MAFLAGHDGVATDQRKSRDLVIESDRPAPARLVVALLAPGSELTLVAVILTVTGHTVGCQLVTIEIARVAGIAFDLGMRGSKREFGLLAVVEADRTPLALIVTGLAFCAVPSAMDVLNSVAIRACRADVLVAFGHMAGGARHGTVGSAERELRPVVIERLHAVPCGLGMAIVASFPEASLVRIIRFMTVKTACGRVAELCRLYMTADARHRRVCVAERKIRTRVIERLRIEQDDVDIPPFVIRVTMGAFLLRRGRIATVKASLGLAISARVFVALQAELRLRSMRERLVTIAALLLELGVSLHERPGHDELLEQVLRSHG